MKPAPEQLARSAARSADWLRATVDRAGADARFAFEVWCHAAAHASAGHVALCAVASFLGATRSTVGCVRRAVVILSHVGSSLPASCAGAAVSCRWACSRIVWL